MVANQTTPTDRIEKTTLLRAPRSRVWRALTDSEEFGRWFQMKLDGPFAAGATVRGKLTVPGYESLAVEMQVDRIDAERYFSYRWHPYAIDPKRDYGEEPMTLVEFFVDEAPEGVRLRLVESGFDRIPLARRAEAFRMNDGGWAQQLVNIETHVARG
jgi:uncharacterized protein YndB with AHSA1/START domain